MGVSQVLVQTTLLYHSNEPSKNIYNMNLNIVPQNLHERIRIGMFGYELMNAWKLWILSATTGKKVENFNMKKGKKLKKIVVGYLKI